MAKVKSLQKRGGLPFLDSAPRWFVIQKKKPIHFSFGRSAGKFKRKWW